MNVKHGKLRKLALVGIGAAAIGLGGCASTYGAAYDRHHYDEPYYSSYDAAPLGAFFGSAFFYHSDSDHYRSGRVAPSYRHHDTTRDRRTHHDDRGHSNRRPAAQNHERHTVRERNPQHDRPRRQRDTVVDQGRDRRYLQEDFAPNRIPVAGFRNYSDTQRRHGAADGEHRSTLGNGRRSGGDRRRGDAQRGTRRSGRDD